MSVIVMTYCPECQKYAQCEIKGYLTNRETGTLEYYYLRCECCNSLFKKEA